MLILILLIICYISWILLFRLCYLIWTEIQHFENFHLKTEPDNLETITTVVE